MSSMRQTLIWYWIIMLLTLTLTFTDITNTDTNTDSGNDGNKYWRLLQNSNNICQYSSLLLLRCLTIQNAAYYDTRSISQLLQSIRNLYWIFR